MSAPVITAAQSNGSDLLFKFTGTSFTGGTTTVMVTNTAGGETAASIGTLSDTQVTGTLPADVKKTAGYAYVKTHPSPGVFYQSNHAVYSNLL